MKLLLLAPFIALATAAAIPDAAPDAVADAVADAAPETLPEALKPRACNLVGPCPFGNDGDRVPCVRSPSDFCGVA